MQTITIAIGKSGIQFFAQHYLIDKLQRLISQLEPPDRTFTVPDFGWWTGPGSSEYYTNVQIALTGGVLKNFSPVYQGLVQGTSGDKGIPSFTLSYLVNDFSANYNWQEMYTSTDCGPNGCNPGVPTSTPFQYKPAIGGMTIPIVVQFLYDPTQQAWEMTVPKINVPPLSGVQINLPSDSILWHQVDKCVGSHADDTTVEMLRDIDFVTGISHLIAGIVASIPGSGDLGGGIRFDFSVGDAGIVSYQNDGIQMGVRGGASYNGEAFSGTPPAALPLPAPPADDDTHQLNMYVSGYEVDALNWAFFKAGKLNALVNPTDLSDPDVLKVKTYTSEEPALVPYRAFAMQAQISPNAAPVTSFQTVYELTAAVMTLLQGQLPTSVYDLLTNLAGNNYITKSDLETDLRALPIDSQYFAMIEDAAKNAGMVVTQDIDYTLVIQTFQPDPPNIVFNIRRTDILGNLKLGIGPKQAQTMQFTFQHASWQASFLSSTVPGFDGANFASTWATAGEPRYDQLLAALGASGVPLPITQGLQFDFDQAQLSIQEGFVRILANVLYKSAS